MKTSEFIEKVEKLEFIEKAAERGSSITIYSSNYALARVETDVFYMLDNCYVTYEDLDDCKKNKLMEIVLEYATTPIEERKDKTIEEKAKEYIQEYASDNLSFESARDFLECCHLYFNDEDKNRKYLIDAHLSNYSQERLKECSEIYDWYHEHSIEFIRMWLEVAECE